MTMAPEKQLDVRRQEHLRWWDTGEGQRAFAGPLARVYGALEIALRDGVEFELVSESPVDARGHVVVTVRFLQRLPERRAITAANGRRRSVRRALLFAGGGVAVAGGAVWMVVAVVRAIITAVAENIAMLLGFGAVATVCAVLLLRRGCEIYVTHIRR
jgi:hypothetical protein